MKPEPVNKHVICSACGLDWNRHGAKPTLATCVKLLKDDLALANARQPVVYPYIPYTPPLRPTWPWYQSTTSASSTTAQPPVSLTDTRQLALNS